MNSVEKNKTFLMPTLPLITHTRADSVIAWRDGRPITAARFLSDVAQLGKLLPSGAHMLNACGDRYRFTVGLAAAMATKKVCLLPSTHTPEMIRQLAQFAPDVFCLTDSNECSIELPRVRFPASFEHPESDSATYAVPGIPSEQLVAYVFTSGSTGVPLAHKKTWGALVRDVQAEAELCGLNDGRQHAVIGTVPPQHMYGFESTVLIVMQSANAMVAGHSFYPADISNAIESVPRPRALVSTPVHMRAVIGSNPAVPAVDLIVSATAPLSSQLAQQLEACFNAPLLEIYGSTETGQIAMRRSTATQEWTLFRGVRLTRQGEVTWACGGHIEQATAMSDVIETIADDRFLLHGRMADMINVAGKRSSLAYLDLQLTAIPDVIDGAFFMPDAAGTEDVMRLTAFVVAPKLTPAALMAALRDRIDPAFLPRPLVFVDALPRNATGKLPRAALQQLAAAASSDYGNAA
jgi:acyl-coenzyme A synthetase/AMP-(fatty) acid ligase